MTRRLKIATFATALIATALTAGVAMAATPHNAYGREHARYASACSTLSGQWSSALSASGHHRKLGAAKHQERIGQRDCRSNKTVEMKVGAQHYRSALRIIGVRPSA